jgi:hypothetical protein
VTGARRLAAPRRDAPVATLALLAVLLIAACVATATPTPSGSAAPASPGASPSADGSAIAPSPTWWPGGVVEAVLNLGKADAQIQLAGGDLGAAAANEDLEAMRGAADGLAILVERLIPQIDRIRDYPETAPAAAAYDAAFPVMLEGATQLRDAIDAGDATGMAAGSQRLAAGLDAYAEARRLIGPLVDQAILMQRLLVR